MAIPSVIVAHNLLRLNFVQSASKKYIPSKRISWQLVLLENLKSNVKITIALGKEHLKIIRISMVPNVNLKKVGYRVG